MASSPMVRRANLVIAHAMKEKGQEIDAIASRLGIIRSEVEEYLSEPRPVPSAKWEVEELGPPPVSNVTAIRPDVAPKTSEPTAQVYRASQLLQNDPPPRPWLVEDMIPRQQVTLLTGDGGVGKSLLALQLMVAVASGTPWLGLDVHRGPVLYFSGEDDQGEVHRRLAGVLSGQAIPPEALDDLHVIDMAGLDCTLTKNGPEGSMIFNSTGLSFFDVMSVVRPRLIVIDTLGKAFPANENDRAKVEQFVGLMRLLAMRSDAALVMIAHPSKSAQATGAGYSGSTAWQGAVRALLSFERVTDENDNEPDPFVRRLIQCGQEADRSPSITGPPPCCRPGSGMTVDKVLADRGMRGKSRGRAFHHITTEEGIFILLGVLGSRRLLSADQVVRDLINFSLDPGSAEAMRVCQNLDQIIGLTAEEVAGSSLIDALASVARHLRSQSLLGHLNRTGGAITLRVSVDGPVLLSVDADSFDGSRQRCELIFFGSTNLQAGDARREASVSHRTLAWIGDISDAARSAM